MPAQLVTWSEVVTGTSGKTIHLLHGRLKQQRGHPMGRMHAGHVGRSGYQHISSSQVYWFGQGHCTLFFLTFSAAETVDTASQYTSAGRVKSRASNYTLSGKYPPGTDSVRPSAALHTPTDRKTTLSPPPILRSMCTACTPLFRSDYRGWHGRQSALLAPLRSSNPTG